ncbi:Rrf2 family transcriptional regulator [Mesorhizobium sp. CAU 1741]|uniref:Rrf2 family transcriptional regulator n=1 Tax=Mesorhizobium sp. CAU 1741 TaxID=3140366 RepID=UPI00325B278D
MRHDTRLSRLLHVLLHMADSDHPMTSEHIARMLGSNPVVVRRIMAGLRERGYVSSEKGHGGGWRLATPLDHITVLDVYKSLGEPDLFAFGLSDPAPRCLVERTVNETVSGTIAMARQALLGRFAELKLSQIASELGDRARHAPHPYS